MTNAPANTLELSPQEAEAVLELWAKKQAEGELRSQLNVQDLAEAMSLPVSEVEKMVDTVRQKASTPAATPPVKQAKPINKPLIALAVVIWFSILAGAWFIAFAEGHRQGRFQAMPLDLPPPALAPMATVVDTTNAPLEMAVATDTPVHHIPRSVAVEIKGYKVYGEQKTNANERQILDSLKSILNEVAPTSSANPDVVYGDVATMNALQGNDPTKVNGQIKFEAMTVQGENDQKTLMIPVAMVSDPDLVRLVLEEQETRLKILANWAFNQRGNPPLSRPGNP